VVSLHVLLTVLAIVALLIFWMKLALASQTPILDPMATPSKTSKEPKSGTPTKTDKKREHTACIPYIKVTINHISTLVRKRHPSKPETIQQNGNPVLVHDG
jgi:hypothetical protein